ncbi:unnamed protein product, partial [Ixodes pacificus]
SARTDDKNWATLRQHAACLQRQCPWMTAKKIYSELKCMSAKFRNDFFANCTQSATQPCFLADKCDPWNRLLREIDMELSEREPGRFGLNCAGEWLGLEGKDRSYLLLHWILTRHRCIKTLVIDRCFSLTHLNLLCDALHTSYGLEELVLICRLDRQLVKAMIPAIASALEGLVKLKISDFRTPECALDLLGAALQKNSRLASLYLSGICMNVRTAELLLSGLATCPGLVDLTTEDYFLFPGKGRTLGNFVAESTALKQLCLLSNACSKVKHLETFFEGLTSNCNLEELHLRDFELKKPTMDLLAKAVVHHSALKVLKVGSYQAIEGGSLADVMASNTGLRELMLGGSDAGCVAEFSRAISKNTRLQKLQLNLSGMKMQDYKELLMALSCNPSLRELEFHSVPGSFLLDLCQLTRNTDTEGRVKFPAEFPNVLGFTIAMKRCFGLTQLTFWPQCRQIEHEYLVDLALFLSQTTTLKEATLSFRTTAESTRVLLSAISRNQSLSKLRICDWTFELWDLQQLYDIVSTNRNLTELHLQLSNYEKRGIIHSLSKHLRSNLNLINVTVDVDYWRDDRFVQLPLRKAIQSNLSTLHRAVLFMMGSRGREFAEAFERTCDLSSLVAAVQKSANQPEEQAKEMVKSSKRYLDCNFLAAVGVVKDVVVCVPNGRVQLDCIGLD